MSTAGKTASAMSLGHTSWDSTSSAYFMQTLNREYRTRQMFSDNKHNLQRAAVPYLPVPEEPEYLVQRSTKSKSDPPQSQHMTVTEFNETFQSYESELLALQLLKQKREKLKAQLAAHHRANPTYPAIIDDETKAQINKNLDAAWLPKRKPRHTLMLAGLGFTSATTEEAMELVLRKQKNKM